MQLLFLILPFALLIAIFFVIVFIIAVRKGQYDDLETPPNRILLDEEKINKEVKNDRK